MSLKPFTAVTKEFRCIEVRKKNWMKAQSDFLSAQGFPSQNRLRDITGNHTFANIDFLDLSVPWVFFFFSQYRSVRMFSLFLKTKIELSRGQTFIFTSASTNYHLARVSFLTVLTVMRLIYIMLLVFSGCIFSGKVLYISQWRNLVISGKKRSPGSRWPTVMWKLLSYLLY